MTNRRLILILSSLILISLILLLLFFSISKKTETIPYNQLLSPTPITVSPTLFDSSSVQLKVINILPKEDMSVEFYIIQQIEINFNTPVDSQNFNFETSPSTKLRVATKPESPNTIVLTPDFVWQEGITTIKILPNTKANNATLLNETVEYRIKTKIPESGQVYE